MLCLTVNLYKLKLANYLQFCLTEGQKKATHFDRL